MVVNYNEMKQEADFCQTMISEIKTLREYFPAQRVKLLASRCQVRYLLNWKILLVGMFLVMAIQGQSALAAGGDLTEFKRIPTQYIAALGNPDATSGSNAESWGLWRLDPGPRGVRLGHYEKMRAAGGIAPAQWEFDSNDWWLEENGLIMESPEFPLPAGKYIVTGNREVTSLLTIHPGDKDGVQRWELADDASLHDVTHLRCRSARYTPALEDSSCSPSRAPEAAFRVTPGALMPPVEGCSKQDYSVLFVVAVAVEN